MSTSTVAQNPKQNDEKMIRRAGGQDSLAANTTSPAIQISNWRAINKNTLVGLFSAALPSGMILNGCQLCESHDQRWIGLPGREWTDPAGAKQYAKLISFKTGAIAGKFRAQILAAIDAYLKAARS
jgi:hypothetical protein